jgi:DNA repair exonuclease SbcCD nuclease subunit
MIKLLHCADLHLDSKMNTNLEEEKARERRRELLRTYERMVAYAREQQIPYILIAGDLFDTRNVSAATRNVVYHTIVENPQITFFYLRGNHDSPLFFANSMEIPANLKLFGTQWTQYALGDGSVRLTGIEFSKEQRQLPYEKLRLEPELFHIVTLHGQVADGRETESRKTGGEEIISLKSLEHHHIDYLALGHVHSFQTGELDSRGMYCYPGCLEGRGFDECGEHGFVVLNIQEKTGTFTWEWVPFASRNLYTVTVDVTDCQGTPQMADRILETLKEKNYSSRSLLKILLTGQVDVTCEKDMDYLTSVIKNQYYALRIQDETRLKISLEEYEREESLTGEFVRKVMSREDLSKEDQLEIIRYGLQALAGEEIGER